MNLNEEMSEDFFVEEIFYETVANTINIKRCPQRMSIGKV